MGMKNKENNNLTSKFKNMLGIKNGIYSFQQIHKNSIFWMVAIYFILHLKEIEKSNTLMGTYIRENLKAIKEMENELNIKKMSKYKR